MDKNQVKSILAEVIPLSVADGYIERKKTVRDTTHIGSLSGNRLNSGTIRSQFIVFMSSDEWERNDNTAKRALHSDQRVFVQTGDDVWDVYSGVELSENQDPILLKKGVHGFHDLIVDERNAIMSQSGNGSCENRTKVTQTLQLIAYGAPGTGKSHGIKRETEGQTVFRTTFHPDSDYASFVGAYKPVMKDDGVAFTEVMRKETGSGQFSLVEKRDQKKGIAYEFVEQVFLKAYVEAWRRKAGADATERVPPVFLVIEEINRGNCAQVFGDVFQLLDRGDDGFSEYEIEADEDLRRHLEKRFEGMDLADARKRVPPEVAAKLERIFKGEILLLPDNLLIRATMNTSDQSLFPIDSAFKRRWDWRYVPILEGRDENTKQPLGWKIAFDTPAGAFEFDWWEFVKRVNNVIGTTTSSEDKKLGYFFVKAERKSVDGEERLVVTAEKLLEEVVFYLWNDVFKDYGIDKIFAKGGKPVEYHCFYDSGTGEIDTALLKEFVESLPEVVK